MLYLCSLMFLFLLPRLDGNLVESNYLLAGCTKLGDYFHFCKNSILLSLPFFLLLNISLKKMDYHDAKVLILILFTNFFQFFW